MRFGIFYEHQLPRPWQPDPEHRLLTEALEQIELADRSGVDYVWEVEHHFLPSSAAELGGFGVPRDAKRAMWEETLDVVTRMFTEQPFAGYSGDFVAMPPRYVLPRPLQKPHPPLWVACSRALTIKVALADFIRALGTGTSFYPLTADGRMTMEGDPGVASRMAEMFGARSVY